jgi:hypothetical protein
MKKKIMPRATRVTIKETERPRRPWMLIALGVLTFAAVLTIQVGSKRLGLFPKKAEPFVYSAAADTFQPMAISSKQAGKLEPPGVAKPLLLFESKPGGSAHQGLAVMGAAEASSRTYVAGAMLENGARLAELYNDHVVLTKGGQTFTLYLPQKGKSDHVASAGVRGLTVGDFPAAAPPIQAPAVRVSSALRFSPVYEGSQITGYTLYAGAKAGQFERWGLKPGDVLVSLAGQPVGSPEELDAMLDQLREGATLTAEVRRGDQRVSATLDGAALVASAAPVGPPIPPPIR